MKTREVPVLLDTAAQVHHRRHPAHIQYTLTWSPAPRRPTCDHPRRCTRGGPLEQSRRHAARRSWCRIVVLMINKMDPVDWSQDAYERISTEFRDSPLARLRRGRRRAGVILACPHRRQRRHPLRQDAVVRGVGSAAPPRALSTSRATATSSMSASRAVRDPAPELAAATPRLRGPAGQVSSAP